jgi:hypothetical protein
MPNFNGYRLRVELAKHLASQLHSVACQNEKRRMIFGLVIWLEYMA